MEPSIVHPDDNITSYSMSDYDGADATINFYNHLNQLVCKMSSRSRMARSVVAELDSSRIQ